MDSILPTAHICVLSFTLACSVSELTLLFWRYTREKSLRKLLRQLQTWLIVSSSTLNVTLVILYILFLIHGGIPLWLLANLFLRFSITSVATAETVLVWNSSQRVVRWSWKSCRYCAIIFTVAFALLRCLPLYRLINDGLQFQIDFVANLLESLFFGSTYWLILKAARATLNRKIFAVHVTCCSVTALLASGAIAVGSIRPESQTLLLESFVLIINFLSTIRKFLAEGATRTRVKSNERSLERTRKNELETCSATRSILTRDTGTMEHDDAQHLYARSFSDNHEKIRGSEKIEVDEAAFFPQKPSSEASETPDCRTIGDRELRELRDLLEKVRRQKVDETKRQLEDRLTSRQAE